MVAHSSTLLYFYIHTCMHRQIHTSVRYILYASLQPRAQREREIVPHSSTASCTSAVRYIHTIHAQIHTCIHTHRHTYAYTHRHTQTLTDTHTHTHTHMRMCVKRVDSCTYKARVQRQHVCVHTKVKTSRTSNVA